MVNDRIADSIFQQIQTCSDEYSILATMNLYAEGDDSQRLDQALISRNHTT